MPFTRADTVGARGGAPHALRAGAEAPRPGARRSTRSRAIARGGGRHGPGTRAAARDGYRATHPMHGRRRPGEVLAMEGWTRRQFLAQTTIAAAVYTLDPHELCCGVSAYAQTSGADSFELKKVGDGVWAAVAASRYKVNSNAAVIETNDGLVIVDTHSKPSAAQALYKEIQGITKKPVKKVINTHFHWDHWQGNQVYAQSNPGCEIIASDQCKVRL